MDLFSKLPMEDTSLFYSYLREYSDGRPVPYEDLSYYLRFWNLEKKGLYRMFDNNFILRKEVKFEKGQEELAEEMAQLRNCHMFIDDFYSYVNRVIDSRNWDIARNLRDMTWDCPDMAVNLYRGPSFTIPAEYTINQKEIQVPSGCKLIKILGKLAKAFGIEEHYEDFRQCHSRILNQKMLTGTLCLSIHPMDYATMSDNECGWTSCMSWTEECGGDYRLGTVEMMNSPFAVVAYLEASEPMCVPDGEWNNKKWRQLLYVTPELILANKQYPYENEFLQGMTLNWLKELAEVTPGYGPYMKEAVEIINQGTNIFGDRHIHISLNMNYMYNDIYGRRLAYFSSTYNEKDYHLNLSGAAVCSGCGEIIELEAVEACSLRCLDCDGLWRCDYCGDSCSGDAYWVGDSKYCYYCYHNELETCEECGDRTNNSDYLSILLPTKEDTPENIKRGFEVFNSKYTIPVCPDCFNSKFFHDIEIVDHVVTIGHDTDHPMTMCSRGVYLDDLSTDLIDDLTYSTTVRNLLLQLRDAKTIEERVEILIQNFYIDFH